MPEQEKDKPRHVPTPAYRVVGPPIAAPHPWPGVPDSSYEVVAVDLADQQPIALCQCVSPAGRGACWWYHVDRLMDVSDEQRAGLVALLQRAESKEPPTSVATPPPPVQPPSALRLALERIRALMREDHAPNLRRQLRWLRISDGNVFAVQTLGRKKGDPSYLALCRSADEAVRLTTETALFAPNRWGKPERIEYQGLYVVGNRLVGRVDEMFSPGSLAVMPEGVITDPRIACRTHLYLDLDTQRRDENGRPVDLPISATGEELVKTIARSIVIADEIRSALTATGIDRPADVLAIMMSGNGVQVWVALDDLPESADLHALVRELLAIWSALYDSDVSHVDTAVHDAKRIGPLAGTIKRKGLRTDLHRRVTFDGAADPRRLTMPELRSLVSLYRGKLSPEQRGAAAKVLGVRPAPAKSQQRRRGGGLDACNEVPIREVAVKLGIDPTTPTCPSCQSGGGSDVAFLDDRNLLNCKHGRCAERPNRTPVDLVALIECGCANIAGTKGVVGRVLAWFQANFGVGGRS